jgi:hypothetical protein
MVMAMWRSEWSPPCPSPAGEEMDDGGTQRQTLQVCGVALRPFAPLEGGQTHSAAPLTPLRTWLRWPFTTVEDRISAGAAWLRANGFYVVMLREERSDDGGISWGGS